MGNDHHSMAPSRNVRFSGLDPHDDVQIVRRRLPHWRQVGVTYFITFRLADSVPQSLPTGRREESAIWLRLHPPPWRSAEQREYEERFIGRMQEWLDAGMGAWSPATAGRTHASRVLFTAFRSATLRCRCICANAEPRSRADQAGSWV